MEKKEFDKLLKIGGFETKKEFANLFELNPKSVNNWGTSQNIPYWVESWLKNYIELKEAKDEVIQGIKNNPQYEEWGDEDFKELNKMPLKGIIEVYSYGRYVSGKESGVSSTTNKEIILAHTMNKNSDTKILDIKDLDPNAITKYANDILKMQKDIEELKKSMKDKKQKED